MDFSMVYCLFSYCQWFFLHFNFTAVSSQLATTVEVNLLGTTPMTLKKSLCFYNKLENLWFFSIRAQIVPDIFKYWSHFHFDIRQLSFFSLFLFCSTQLWNVWIKLKISEIFSVTDTCDEGTKWYRWILKRGTHLHVHFEEIDQNIPTNVAGKLSKKSQIR